MESMLLVYTDGASRNNQLAGARSAGIGWRILDNAGNILEEGAEAVGEKTNNEAEYLAIIKALRKAKKYGNEIILHSDSELVVRQLRGEYKIKKAHLLQLYGAVKKEEAQFGKVSYVSVRRENPNISAVDLLVNLALDEASG